MSKFVKKIAGLPHKEWTVTFHFPLGPNKRCKKIDDEIIMEAPSREGL